MLCEGFYADQKDIIPKNFYFLAMYIQADCGYLRCNDLEAQVVMVTQKV